MITFHYENIFALSNQEKTSNWIENTIFTHGFELGEVNYIFCDDAYLLKLNKEFLQHDTLTDIISFDNTLGKHIAGDIFISVERVQENAVKYKESFFNEIHRVLIHGILHFMGYKDKTEEEKKEMRRKENECLNKLNN